MKTKKQLYKIAYRNVRIADRLYDMYVSVTMEFGEDSIESQLAYDAYHKALRQVSWDIMKCATISRLLFEGKI